MKLRDSGDGTSRNASGNPHVWLDPILVRDRILPRLTDFLVSIAPAADSGAIRARASALADTLTALDTDIREILAKAPRRRFVATHDAWVYFAARYGLESVGSIYEHPGHEPSAQELAHLIDTARKDSVTTILAEPQLAETGARAIAGELGATVRVVDPLGGPNAPGRNSYVAMMRTNARIFALALGAP
jgi:zinc transport system substrate-binding protein